MKQLLNSDSARPFRYLVTGGMAWLVDLAVFTLLLPVAGIAPAQLAARTAGAVAAFAGHKLFVFRSLGRNPAALMTQTLAYAAIPSQDAPAFTMASTSPQQPAQRYTPSYPVSSPLAGKSLAMDKP